jgi:hypothetical protein
VNTTSGQVCSAMGMMFVDICGIIVNPNEPVLAVPFGEPIPISFSIANSGEVPAGTNVPIMFKAFPSDMVSSNEVVSLNGLPPGTRYIGNLVAPPVGSTTTLELSAAFITPDSFRWYDVILEADLDGDGQFQPLTSVGLRQTEASVLCPSDLNADGTVDAADLAILLGGWGTGGTVADINGDGLVDGSDLAQLLGAWGGC